VIADPERRGRSLAVFFGQIAPRLFTDLEESGVLDGLDAAARGRARLEWDCFALYACVRGLVAAGGFNRETAAAIEALHEAALATTVDDAPPRTMIAERYAEYGAIGQAGGRDGAEIIAKRLGEAAARHVADAAAPELAETIGALHQSLVEGATEAVRSASDRS
jgi:hypothetical protein